MDDMTRGVVEAETPVNPYSLLDAVNRSSISAHRAWLIFVVWMAYLLVAVAGVSHKDLLLGSDIALPLTGVKIGLVRFFVAAPVVLVLVHAALLAQLVLLSRKTLEFAASIRMLESTDRRSHPLRLELDNFFFAQAVAGPERSRLVGGLLHGMSWLSIVIMPVALLLLVQVIFLPYHDVAVTWVHRWALIADIVVLALVGVFVWRLETSYFRALLRATLHHPIGFAVTFAVLAGAAASSLLIATIPGEGTEQSAGMVRQTAAGYASPELPLLGLFPRNLDVSDADLMVGRNAAPGEVSVNLRGRDLRFARLDRTDLRQADLTGSDLDGASLAGADLRGAWLGCANLNLLADDRRAAKCASARGANFVKARLAEARMAGADLRGARLDEAQLEGAQMRQAAMSGASLAGAWLDRADLTGAWLQGASFVRASLQGADLSGARLQTADLGAARLQGASLSRAGLEAASLREAELDGANLQMARLQGADLGGAKLPASDMKGAQIWRTALPAGGEATALADLAQIVLQPSGEEDMAAWTAAIARLEAGPVKARLTEALAALTDAGPNAAWSSSADQQQWLTLARSSEAAAADGYKGRLTDHLGRLACRPRFAGGAVAAGVARRALAPGFKGDLPALYDKLKAADCAASGVGARLMRELATAAGEAARGP